MKFKELLAMAGSNRIYAGIGSRDTPVAVLDHIENLARVLAAEGFVLRSGGAKGADSAFERGAADALKDIFLPWKGFNRNASPLFEPSPEALLIAAQHHPSWNGMHPRYRKFHARNVQQVLGLDLKTPCAFVLCWTPDGADGSAIPASEATGGTAQAIRVATSHRIPVFNLASINVELV